MHVITGGAGFLGSALLWQLNNMEIEDIIIVDNLEHGDKWRNLVKRSYADYMHRDIFMELARGRSLPWSVETIFHLGACSSTTEKDADFLMENNFHYSRDLCLFALEKGARFINASSAATYGAGEHGFSDSRDLVKKLKPLNMYGYSKQLFDLWLLRENLDSSVASLKFFNVYGPNEYHKGPMKSVAAKIYREIKRTGKAFLFASNNPAIADGEQKRDFVYVKDCVKLMAWLMENPGENGIRNVGTGRARTFNQVARIVFNALGKEPVIEYRPMPAAISPTYQNYTRADMSWLEKSPYPWGFMDIQDGITDYVRNYLEKNDNYL